MAGAPAISWAGVRVVKAATELTSGQKLLWLEIWGLADKSPDRCYMGAGNLGRRVGMGSDNVEKVRRELKRSGVLGSAERPGKRESSWWPILPANCSPSSERPSDDEVCQLAHVLDDHIRRTREADHSTPIGTQRRPGNGVLQSASAPTRNGVLQSAHEGGKGGDSTLAPSPLPEGGTTSPLSPPSEAGSFASEQEREEREAGPNANSDSADETLLTRVREVGLTNATKELVTNLAAAKGIR
jgi:hypothetical protein